MTFQEQFGRRLLGEHTEADTPSFKSGLAAFDMVSLIEQQHDRAAVPEVFLALAAINDAQTGSLFQHKENRNAAAAAAAAAASSGVDAGGGSGGVASSGGGGGVATPEASANNTKLYEELLEQSCYKGGTSVLADAHMVNGRIPTTQSAFAFALGFALQMVDDLQDSEEDGADGQDTLLTLVDSTNKHDVSYAEATARRLATFLEYVCTAAGSSNGDSSPVLAEEGGAGAPASAAAADKGLRDLILTMTWNMVLKAVARNQGLFSVAFLKEWGPLGPLPPAKMEHLQSLKGLHRLALKDLI